jgi:hypothetical protein
MQPRRIFSFCLLAIGLIYFENASAQSAPTSLSPANKESNLLLHETEAGSLKRKHRKGVFAPGRQVATRKPNYKHTARYEFYVRIEESAKQKQRIIKKLSKAQYSDPRYFGHKRIPKRRAPNKMRYCGECGIRH